MLGYGTQKILEVRHSSEKLYSNQTSLDIELTKRSTGHMQVRGVIPPLTTPFTKTGEVYEQALRNLLEFQIEKGSHGVFLCGTYGSGPLMSIEQRESVVEIATEQAKGHIAIIAHVGTASTEDALRLAEHAERSDVDAIAAIPPYYYRHDEETVIEHYKQLVEAVGTPVYAYNNPKTSGFTITPSTLSKLADIGVKGIKDSGFSLVDFSHLVIELADREDFNFIIGTSNLLLPAMLLGAKGAVSGIANAFPEIVVELYNTIVEKKYEEAAKLQLKVNQASKTLRIARSTNAACYAMLKERGIDVGVPKRPILPITDEELIQMRKAFARIGPLES
jgi:4-hydroxy-tetrahydrodipicolinate synthase